MSEPDLDVLTDPADTVAVAVPVSDAACTTQAGTPTAGEREAAARMGLPARLGRVDYKWVALAVVLGGSIMTILDATVVNVAIPSLQQALHAGSYNDIAWVVTGYMLAQGAVIPMTGWATDRFGTKRLYLITLVLFTAASMACGLSWNLGSLILFRVLQGIGGGMLMPIGMTIILRAVGPQEMGRVMGVFGVPMLLGPAIGPVLGGWFVQDFSWRLIFYINVPIGVVALFAAWRLLVETPVEHKLKLDVPGLLTGIPAVCALMFGVDRSTTLGWGSPLVVSMLAASAVLFAVFVVRQRTADEPLLHLRLFNDTTFTMSILLSLVMVTALFGAMFLLPVYLQQVHGYDAITTGLLLMPQAVTAAIMMPIGGHLSDRIGPRPTVLIGLVALAAGSIMLAQVHAYSSLLLVVAAMGVRGIAMGFSMMPSMAAGLARIPRESTSRASSITNTVQRAGSSVALAVLVTVLAGQAATGAAQASCEPSPRVLAAAATAHLPATRDAFCGALVQRAGSFSTDATAKPAQSVSDPALASFLKDYRNEAASITFDRIFALLAIVAVVGAIPALFLRRPDAARRGRDGDGVPPE